jgi:hypothetical protein
MTDVTRPGDEPPLRNMILAIAISAVIFLIWHFFVTGPMEQKHRAGQAAEKARIEAVK